MRHAVIMKKIISSAIITAALMYFIVRTTSHKLIFVPFLICAVAMMGQNIALLRNNTKIARLFHALFASGFFLFWFGFLAVAAYVCIRDKS